MSDRSSPEGNRTLCSLECAMALQKAAEFGFEPEQSSPPETLHNELCKSAARAPFVKFKNWLLTLLETAAMRVAAECRKAAGARGKHSKKTTAV